ncbi:MAG: response regulator [Candidatus Moranbacteria bacterium]|nr:response regulator [Candidatus Moranbacteria bacterium]
MNILIVDDNAHDREAISFFLNSHGYDQIVQAENGEECIAMALEHFPDVVILDVQLPDIQGYGICKALKSQPVLNCQIILMTGQFQLNDPYLASDASPDYFLAKTGVYDELLKILRSMEAAES